MKYIGKKLLFMGGEFAQFSEWAFARELDWNLYDYPAHETANIFFKDVVKMYKNEPALYQTDHNPAGFQWIDSNNRDQSIFSYIRYSADNFDDHLVIVMNATPNVYHGYEIGVPGEGIYEEILNSDKIIYGGSGQYNGAEIFTFPEGRHNQPHHIKILIPPLGIAVFKMKKQAQAPASVDLTVLTLKELKAMAKEKGVKGYSSMKKEQLLKELQ